MEHHYPECIACDVTMCIRCCSAGALVIECYRSNIQFFLVMASETPKIYAMFGYKFTQLDLKNSTTYFENDAIHTNIWLKICRGTDGVNPNTS